MKLRFLALAGVLALACAAPAEAQQARVFSGCAGPVLTSGDGTSFVVDAIGKLCITTGGSASFSVARTTGIGTTGVQVSAADPANRRTVSNIGSVACEIMPGATAYGTGYPLAAGQAFTFDDAGRTKAAIFVACSAAGGSVAVMSY